MDCLPLAWLNANRKLFVGRSSFVEATRAALSASPPADEIRNAVEKNYRWRQVAGAGLHELEPRVTGRVVITNYDLRALSDGAIGLFIGANYIITADNLADAAQ